MFYEYKCDNCDTIETIQHGMTENPEFICEKCKGKMRRLITGGAGVHYVGQGWPSKGSGLYSNPKGSTKEVGVAVNPAMAGAVNSDLAKTKR